MASRSRRWADAQRVIAVTPARVDRLAEQFEAVRGGKRPRTPVELARLVEDSVREEVYYREALTLGLDRDDPVIRRRLRQKMEFLSEGAAASRAGRGRARGPPRRPSGAVRGPAPDHLPAGVAHRGRRGRGGARSACQRCGSVHGRPDRAPAGGDGGVLRGGGRRGLRAGLLRAGRGAAAGRLGGAGAVGYGAHLVEVLAFEPARLRPFEAVRAAVEQDWHRANAAGPSGTRSTRR
jgi:peptidyl-prolyl cis-trans isomerase C